MTYKIKSLIYLSCFVVAAFIYNGIQQEDEFQAQLKSKEFVEADFEDANKQEKSKENLLEKEE
ncbi:hypothetical protein DKG77_06525 [Flagellimonas aquimarina]|jgi:hypothetical protein|uniref:Uncharacterized protein n=1 Tax=Flagellimonas aquimarina TaxID=2201895 RepID=A0A316LK23_9FLAO|nr:hypothetical protein [Allomuricauda koreensis]PWL40460.1 hypothetical protein DKG77_06525 [Allomuricauda koreensis]